MLTRSCRYLAAAVSAATSAASTGTSSREGEGSTAKTSSSSSSKFIVGGSTSYSNGSGSESRSPPQQFAQPGLEGLRIAVYLEPTSARDFTTGKADQAVAVGNVMAQLSDSTFAVDFRNSCLTPFVEIGSRVYVAYEREGVDEAAAPATPSGSGGDATTEGASGPGAPPQAAASSSRGFLMGGLVIKVNPNATFGVLLDNNRLDLAVPRDRIILSEGRCKFLDAAPYRAVVEWVASAGVKSLEDQQSTACILYARGWRAERLYLLESADVQRMAHLNKSARMSIMEKAEWQRDHHRQMRSIYKERVKEKDKRYFFSKYAGILSASVAFCGAFSLFGWNYKNYLKQQRSYQMRFAVKALSRKVQRKPGLEGKYVERPDEERWLRNIFRQLDTAHPRIVVVTGYFGCGKSSLCRTAIEKEDMAAVFVDVRNKEDTVRCVIKALGVPNVDACGDPLDFVSEACMLAKQAMGGKTPIIVLKLREGDNLTRVYNEGITLACDRRMCHLVIEVPMESLTMANTSLPRLDFYTVPNFNRIQAYQYIQHRLDPLDVEQFIDTIGTNSNDLDELFAAVHQRGATPTEYTNQKLLKAMRQLQSAWLGKPQLRRAVRRLASFPYEEGQHEGIDEAALRHPLLKDVVIYNPVQDVWLFASQVLHTAARCCL